MREIKIRDKETGIVYSNNMSDENKHTILSLNFCTSYTEVEVQDNLGDKFPTKSLVLPPLGTEPNWVDLIAIQKDVEGEWL